MSKKRTPTKPPPKPTLRSTRRPTVMIPAIAGSRLQEACLGAFNRFDVGSMDMEALMYFALKAFEPLEPDQIDSLRKVVKEHILKNFAIHQSGPLRIADVSMYKLVVCYTDDTDV